LNQIGVAGAVTQLRQLEALAILNNAGTAAIQAIQVQIQSDLNSTQQGLEFDMPSLPSNVNLPGLYSARQVEGGTGAQQFQDNRVVTIQVVSSDPTTAGQSILAALNSAPVYGNTPRGYT
jgi:hypothetical protein